MKLCTSKTLLFVHKIHLINISRGWGVEKFILNEMNPPSPLSMFLYVVSYDSVVIGMGGGGGGGGRGH